MADSHNINIETYFKYPEVMLYKHFVISNGNPEAVAYSESPDLEWFETGMERIGSFHSLAEARKALKENQETDERVFAYEIIGPEQGDGDDSQLFNFVMDPNLNVISSYLYNSKIANFTMLSPGDKAWIMISLYHYLNRDSFRAIIPVEIMGFCDETYWKEYIREGLIERDIMVYGENAVAEPSPEYVNHKYEGIPDITEKGLVFRPLLTLKWNNGETPFRPEDHEAIPFFFPINIING